MSRDRYAELKAERQRQQQQQQQHHQPYPQEQYGGGYNQSSNQPYGQDPGYNAANSTAHLVSGNNGPPGAVFQDVGNTAYYPQSNQYEMQGMGGGAGYPPASTGKTQNDFFEQVDVLSGELRNFKANIDAIGTLHTRVLNSGSDEHREQEAKDELARVSDEMTRQTKMLRGMLENLAAWPPTQGGEAERNTRKMQVGSLKKKFMDLIQEYREVEARTREKYRDRVARQYKIVKPDATPEEIKEAVNSEHGEQVFANALTQSTRYQDARNVYREVQERRAEITKLAETMVQLQELFNDLANMVEQQDHQVVQIESTAQKIEADMEVGHKEIVKGQVSAKKARKKRVWCFWLIIIILLVAGIAIALSILHKNGTI